MPAAPRLAPALLDTGLAVRLACRSGGFTGPTAGVAGGFVQANLAVLPAALAEDFLRFCNLNPKPCPLLGTSDPGARALPALGADLDLATDLPGYRLWRDGEVVGAAADASPWWRDDLVAFALGCSFSFEAALIEAGVPVRHVELGRNVPMYRTNRPCAPAGAFAGPLVVSMRPLTPADAARAVEITARFPAVHGAPVHLGDPAALGIAELSRPDYGDAVPVHAGEIPVFWACGVTPQAIIAAARLPFAITHAPGKMLVTDLANAALMA